MQYNVRIVSRAYRFALRHLLGTVLGSITHVATQVPVAALTFDDGPHPASTPQLLDILAKHQALATFFMLGEAAHRYPDLVRHVAEAGHAIGNHSWDHASFPLLTRRERFQQIRACEHALAPYGQRLFRPPFGEQNVASRFDLLCCRYRVITWNMDSEDWWNADASAMADRLVRRIRPGCVVVLHDTIHRPDERQNMPPLSRQTHYDRGAMLAAVDTALERLGQRFRFVTVPQLLRHGAPRRKLWSSWQDATPAKKAI